MLRRACALSEREKYGLTRISIKKLLHNNKTNIVEFSPLFLMSNFWCRQGKKYPTYTGLMPWQVTPF